MPYKLQPDETDADAAWHLLGDRRLTHEIKVINGQAYLNDEKPGPPAQWAADPARLKGPSR